MDYQELGSHARGAYPTQYTSRMETARMKQEEEADTRTIVIEQYEIWKKGMWAQRGKSPEKGLTTAKDLPVEFPEGRESSYHKLG